MNTHQRLILVGLIVVVAFVVGNESYRLTDQYSGNSFFDGFNFFTDNDPTNGYVNYVSQQQAQQLGLITTTNSLVVIRSDSSNVASGRGRNSVRIQSNNFWKYGLFVLDLNHMPEGCGTWPAWWIVGNDWPNNGEVDIIEGVNTNNYDSSTLHTNQGCDMSVVDRNSFTGTLVYPNCWVGAPNQPANAGCSIQAPSGSYGSSLNNMGGGVYATLWNTTNIIMWFWPHDKVPNDLTNNNPDPNNGAWGKPYALFVLGSNCPNYHFGPMQLVMNNCFCGDWAGAVFGQQCPGKGSCNNYVQYNPSAFEQSYWAINFVKVFQ